MDPIVSVVVPHYNRPARLLQTIASVQAQTFRACELVIVDDASPQDPAEALAAVMADPRIQLIRLARNGGPSIARNVGAEAAAGRFVAYLDSDDLWAPEKLETQLSAILAAPDPDRAICATQVLKKGPKGREEVAPARAVRAGEDFAEYLIINGGITQTSAIMLSRKAALEVRFDPTLRQFEDYLFFIRAGGLGLAHVLAPGALVTWFNDERPDRLSRSAHQNMDNARRFLEAAGPLIGERARLCFLTKHMGVNHAREGGPGALFDVLMSATRGLISWPAAARTVATAYLPRTWVAALRTLKTS